VFQSYALWPHKTVAQNIAFPLEMKHLPQLDIRRQVIDTMAKLGISALERRYPAQLSGGQRQRVALARALVGSPSLLIMDEPLSSLDVSLRRSIQRELLDLREQWRPTVLYVTHDQEEAMRLADRIIVLHEGIIQQQGTAAELYHSPQNTFVADFFGASSFLNGVVVESSANRCQVVVSGMEGVINARSADCLARGSRASILLRPNWFRLPLDLEQGATEDGFNAIVSHMEFLGQHTSYRFSWRGSELSVVESRSPRFNIGDAVHLTLDDAWSIPGVVK
jgi:ABC-type Fe3+/spermidine/putrescine transport system ATPase subunit